MRVKCNVCEEEFTFLINGETFGMTEGNDYNIHKIECPNPDCQSRIIIKNIIYYEAKNEN